MIIFNVLTISTRNVGKMILESILKCSSSSYKVSPSFLSQIFQLFLVTINENDTETFIWSPSDLCSYAEISTLSRYRRVMANSTALR